MSRFYLTTPLYYVNARPHLGHAYSTIVADTVVRFRRQMGEDAEYLTGTDEHGQKLQRAAEAAGISPQQFTDEYAARFRQEWDRLGLHYSYFIRTTEARHTAAVLEIFERLKKQGYIYKGEYSGAYCVFDELYVEGVPGTPCPECGRPTESLTEENYYFKLSAFEDRLLQLYREHPEFIRPESRRNEVVSFVQGGLRDVSISRTSIHWGIPVPGDEKHVLYVWFDALIGYLSGIGYGSSNPEDQKRVADLWPAWHLVGKEIVRFHAVYWPAFLMAAGLPLPKGIIAHGWLLFEEEKMSKSRGNVVRSGPIRQTLGTDALRYFLLREISFGNDGSFSFDSMVGRYNSDLANDWGNLASRTLSMIGNYFGGVLPAAPQAKELTAADQAIVSMAEQASRGFQIGFCEFQFSRGLEAVWQLIGAVNRYLVESEPWTLAKKQDDAAARRRLEIVLYVAAEALRFTAVLLSSIMPESTVKLWNQLGFAGTPELPLGSLEWGGTPAGQKIGVLEPLFPRMEKTETVEKLRELEAQSQAEAAKPAAPAAAPAAPAEAAGTEEVARINIDDFAKVDLRVGQVKTAEKVKGADKLLCLTVDIGTEVRQIVAGIAEAYDPATLPGRKVVIVANLQPRKLRGLESNGMIVAASYGEKGKPVLVSVPDDTPNGARLR
jgi:methionyl-tRNA synthetase